MREIHSQRSAGPRSPSTVVSWLRIRSQVLSPAQEMTGRTVSIPSRPQATLGHAVAGSAWVASASRGRGDHAGHGERARLRPDVPRSAYGERRGRLELTVETRLGAVPRRT